MLYFETRKAGHVAARSSQTIDVACADRIGDVRKHDRYSARRSPQWPGTSTARGEDDVRRERTHAPHPLRLLRAHRVRPRCHNAAEQRDDLASFHLIQLHFRPAGAGLHDFELAGTSVPVERPAKQPPKVEIKPHLPTVPESKISKVLTGPRADVIGAELGLTV